MLDGASGAAHLRAPVAGAAAGRPGAEASRRGSAPAEVGGVEPGRGLEEPAGRVEKKIR
ncbi:MAG: hypothetical protein HPY58_06560 [Firmicutes bacterium]|nr:hypothetical protein [Bacillota bacterium]